MKVISGLLILVLLFITACEEEDFIPREYPIVRTLAVSNITESGEITLNGEILDTGADAVISHGFIISEDSESTFEDGLQVDLGVPEGTGTFSYVLTNGITASSRYYIRAFATDGSFTVLGDIVEFEAIRNSPPIELLSFDPIISTWDQPIVIQVDNFNPALDEKPVLKFGNAQAVIDTVTQSSITAFVPRDLSTANSKIFITWFGQTVESDDLFQLHQPVATSFNPSSSGPSGIITLTGQYFHPDPAKNTATIGSTPGLVTSAGISEIEVEVPALLPGEHTVTINTIGSDISFAGKLTFLGPEAGSFSPSAGGWDTEVLLTGQNFGTDPNDVEVMIGQTQATVTSMDDQNIRIMVPEMVPGEYTLSVKIQLNPVDFNGLFTVEGPVVESVNPPLGVKYDQIQIIGRNFPADDTEIEVYLDEFRASVISGNQMELNMIVPDAPPGFYALKLVRGVAETTHSELFEIQSFSVDMITPLSGNPSSIIEILGTNFREDMSNVSVYFGTEEAEIVSVNDTRIEVRVPLLADGFYPIRINIRGDEVIFPQDFEVAPPVIDMLSPSTAAPNDVVTLTGSNFSNVENLKVFVGNIEASVISGNSSVITFYAPGILGGTYSVSVEFDEIVTSVSPTDLNINNAFPDMDLEAFYPFNNAVVDASGNFFYGGGVPHIVPAPDRFGIPNSAFEFDGINDFLVIGNAEDFYFDQNKPFSISVWAAASPNQTTLTAPVNDIISRWNFENGQGEAAPFSIRYLNSTAGTPFRFVGQRDQEAGPEAGIKTLTDANDDQWHHLALTYDGTVLRIYFDGVENDSVTETLTMTSPGGYVRVRIGGGEAVTGRYFKGKIDDIAVYSRALTLTEIQWLASH